ncbi:MAG: hypothetical protein K6357_02035 [Elusimicrobiota bacterium]
MKQVIYIGISGVCLLLNSCGKNIIKSELNKDYNVEIVEAEGSGPIVDNNIDNAKKTSLSDALKNALHLVVGVYISGETLVSKSVLIDDEITSRSEGYIEKYEVLKEYIDGNFYKTKVRAYVRKEDLASKLKRFENEVEKIGSPVIYANIIDEQTQAVSFALDALISDLRNDSFRVFGDIKDSDVIIDGKIQTKFNTSEGLGGFISYVCTISGNIKTKNDEIISGFNASNGGIGLTEQDAKNNASVNCVKKVYPNIKDSILNYYNQKKIVKFEVDGVSSLNSVNDLIKYFRNIPIIRTAVVKNYDKETAVFELLLHKGKASDIIGIISKNTDIEVVKVRDFYIMAKYKK